MPDWDSLADTYADAVKSAFPLHRLVLVVLGLLGSIAAQHLTHKSVVETIVRLPLDSIRLGEGGFLQRGMVADLVIGFLLALCAWVISGGLVRLVYALASRSIDLQSRMRATTAGIERDGKAPLDEVKMLSEFIDSALELPRKRLRSINAGGELAAGIACAGFVAAFWGNALDAAVGAIAMAAAVVYHVVGTRVFLSEYLGPALLKSSLMGKELPSPRDAVV